MGHIHTAEGQHDVTASAFLVRTDLAEPHIVLHMHKKLGMLLQFGGHVELAEHPWQAIAHELLEESGYDIAKLKVLQPRERLRSLSGTILHPQPIVINTHEFKATDYKHSHTDISFAFTADGPPTAGVRKGESDQMVLLARRELAELPAEKIYDNVRDIALYVLDVCMAAWEPVATTEYSLD